MKAGLGTETGGADPTTQARFTPPTPEELAALFPQFEILSFIGQGGMGAVYKARQKQLDRIVALKILPPSIGQDPAFAERFAREARAMAKLNHPGIVTIYDFGQAQAGAGQMLARLYYFIMEFVDGVSLRQLLQAGRVAPREALAIVPQICDALQYAHDQGIIHRDIKPENILLDRLGRVKVADFGLAKLVAAGSDVIEASKASLYVEGLTAAGKILGTPNYMAPEQVDHPADVDHRADLYALGVVFYQMLTGELPGKRIEPPSRKVRLDVRLDEVVLQALEKNPARRYQQASEVKTALENISGKSAETSTNPTPRGFSATPGPSSSEGGAAHSEPSVETGFRRTLQRLKTAFTMRPLERQLWMRRSLRLERNIILPIKVALAIMLFVSLFLGRRGGTLMDVVGESIEVNLRTLSLPFVIYIAITLAAFVLLFAARRLPMRLVHVAILATILVDGCLIAVLAFFTGGADSPLYWLLIALVVRGAAVEQRIVMQLLLGLTLSFCYLVAGYAAGYVDSLIASHGTVSDWRVMDLYAMDPFTAVLWPRFMLLVLVSCCCGGIQLLLQPSGPTAPRPKSRAESTKTAPAAVQGQRTWLYAFAAGILAVLLVEFAASALMMEAGPKALVGLPAGGVALVILLVAPKRWLGGFLACITFAFFLWLALAALMVGPALLGLIAFAAALVTLFWILRKCYLPAGFMSSFLTVYLVVFGASALVTAVMPESYVSMARIEIQRNAAQPSSPNLAPRVSGFYDPYFIQTEFEVINSDVVLGKVIRDLDLENKWGQRYGRGQRLKPQEVLGLLKMHMDLRPVRNTSLIEIRVFSEIPEEAAVIANKIAYDFQAYEQSTFGATTASPVSVEIVDVARPGPRPVRPNKVMNLAIGALAGLLLGTVVANTISNRRARRNTA